METNPVTKMKPILLRLFEKTMVQLERRWEEDKLGTCITSGSIEFRLRDDTDREVICTPTFAGGKG